MPKLHQILAVEADIRNQASKDLTVIYHNIQKPDLVAGLFKEYQPVAEDGQRHAPERKALQIRVPEQLKLAAEIMEKQFDIVATRDVTNCGARADLVLEDGTVLGKNLPSMYLLWLEKKLEELHAVVIKLPTLPADMEWKEVPEQKCWQNKHEIKNHRAEKEEHPLVLLQPTQYHPGQAKSIVKDTVVGHWTTTLYSGALTLPQAQMLKARVEELSKAVKMAREKANQIEIVDTKVGGGLMKHLFGGI